MWAIRSPKGFGFNPHLAEKRGTLLLQATFGHTVVGISHPQARAVANVESLIRDDSASVRWKRV